MVSAEGAGLISPHAKDLHIPADIDLNTQSWASVCVCVCVCV